MRKTCTGSLKLDVFPASPCLPNSTCAPSRHTRILLLIPMQTSRLSVWTSSHTLNQSKHQIAATGNTRLYCHTVPSEVLLSSVEARILGVVSFHSCCMKSLHNKLSNPVLCVQAPARSLCKASLQLLVHRVVMSLSLCIFHFIPTWYLRRVCILNQVCLTIITTVPS